MNKKIFKVIDLKTGEETDGFNCAKSEPWASNLMAVDLEGFAITQCGDLVLMDKCGQVAFCPGGRFQVILEIGH